MKTPKLAENVHDSQLECKNELDNHFEKRVSWSSAAADLKLEKYKTNGLMEFHSWTRFLCPKIYLINALALKSVFNLSGYQLKNSYVWPKISFFICK